MVEIVSFKDITRKGVRYLLITEKSGSKSQITSTFPIRRSLLRPPSEMEPVIHPSDFLSNLTISVDRGTHDKATAHLLQSHLHDNSATLTPFPLLGRKIIAGSVKWGCGNLKIFGEFTYIPGYWEWTEDVLSRHEERLRRSSIFAAVYASLYSYARDPSVFRAFCECWCPVTNTLHTIAGEVSISLWDLHKICGLPISGAIYDETVPDYETLLGYDKQRSKPLSRACSRLFIAYDYLDKRCEGGVSAETWIGFWCKRPTSYKAPPRRRRSTASGPTKTHNPDGNIRAQSRPWTKEELEVFKDLDIVEEDLMDKTYLAAFISCWLCAFVLPETEDRLIRPNTFEVATHMATRGKVSLAVPVLASVYRGLNGISESLNPAHSKCYFPAHFVYGWLACYFGTHYTVKIPPPGPLMARFSGAQGAKWMSKDEARQLFHNPAVFQWDCNISHRNRIDNWVDDGQLDPSKVDYLINLGAAYLPLRCGDSFHVEPYSPHRFGRQFGFCQDVPGKLLDSHPTHIVSCAQALRCWRLILRTGSESRLFLPSLSLNLNQLVTEHFQVWWPKVGVNDLKGNICLQKGTEANITKPRRDHKKGSKGKAHADVPHLDIVESRETNGVQENKASKRKFAIVAEGENSDEDSEVNFKHRRGKKNKAPKKDIEGIHEGDIFKDVPEFSDVPDHLVLTGDFDLGKEVSRIHDESLLNNVDLDTPSTHQPRSGKVFEVMQQLNTQAISGDEESQDDEGSSSSPPHSQHSVHGPHSLEVAARGIDHTSSKGEDILRTPSYASGKDTATSLKVTNVMSKSIIPVRGSPVGAQSVTSFRPGPVSRNIFAQAIRDIGAKFLESLRDAPFEDVDKRYQEASTVYQGIIKLKGDPTALKCKVDSYVALVRSYIALASVAAQRKQRAELEKEIASYTEKVKHAESHLTLVRSENGFLTKKRTDVEGKIARLEKELQNACEERKKVEKDLDAKQTMLKEVEGEVTIAKQALADAEASETLSPEEVTQLEEHKKSLLELQSSLKPTEWMDQ